MRAAPKCLIALIATWGTRAHGEEPTLSDEDLAKLAEGEAIEIFDERPDKPFDRDTEVRLTGEELVARGAVDLATALALLPDVTVRDVGRGGFNVDIRGARKGAVSVLVDGVLVSDPYYGTFDVSTIPVTDIVQIKMSTTPQSPIDGPGGPGGVIEVLTRDAIGAQIVIARAMTDTLPSFGVAGMARAALARHTALRISASGTAGARDFELAAGSLSESRRAASGAARLEYRDATRRAVLDAFLDDRRYIAPPSDTGLILLIDRETTARASVKGDLTRDKWQLQGQAFVHHLHRRSRSYMDATLQTEQRMEDLSALRVGGAALVTHPIGKDARWVASTSLARDSADVLDTVNGPVSGATTLLEAAGDVQYEKRTFRLDGAAGVAVPFGIDASPWPEAKLVAKWRPRFGPVELTATGARKGRVPSLRERFETGGNAALDPEHISQAELRAVGEIKERFRIEVAPFYRYQTGTIRSTMGMLRNLDAIDLTGVDLNARVNVERRIAIGAAYDFIHLRGDTLDRLPAHRAEAWVQVQPQPFVTIHTRGRYYGAFLDQGMSLPGYFTLEATATATLGDYVLVLRAEDLLDSRPQTRLGYFGAGRVISFVLHAQW